MGDYMHTFTLCEARGVIFRGVVHVWMAPSRQIRSPIWSSFLPYVVNNVVLIRVGEILLHLLNLFLLVHVGNDAVLEVLQLSFAVHLVGEKCRGTHIGVGASVWGHQCEGACAP